jgi:DNA-binding LytR/AlgR family response regulator
MIRILIVEDEELAALRLQKMLLEIDPQIKITAILDSVSETINWIKNNPLPDLILLDIQLSDGISFEIFNNMHIECPVIFVTAYDNYALKAFELNSIDYLLKPLRKELLQNSIEKFKKRTGDFSSEKMMQKNQTMVELYSHGNNSFKTVFAVFKGDSITTVQSDQIAYFYIEDKAVFLISYNGEKNIINYSLDQLEAIMNPKEFFRVNRQYFVSLKSIVKATNYFYYKIKIHLNPASPTEVIISANKATEFKQWLDGV